MEIIRQLDQITAGGAAQESSRREVVGIVGHIQPGRPQRRIESKPHPRRYAQEKRRLGRGVSDPHRAGIDEQRQTKPGPYPGGDAQFHISHRQHVAPDRLDPRVLQGVLVEHAVAIDHIGRIDDVHHRA